MSPPVPPYRGVFSACKYTRNTNMKVLFTLSKQMDDDRTSIWRFVQTDEGFWAIAGNYKLLSYRNKFGMDRSKKWFMSKGYTLVK